MINGICDFSGPVVVQIREGDFILSPDRMSDNNFADVIELIPVFIKIAQISVQRLEFRSSGNGNI